MFRRVPHATIRNRRGTSPFSKLLSRHYTVLWVIFLQIFYLLLCQTSLVIAASSSRRTTGGGGPPPPPPPPPPSSSSSSSYVLGRNDDDDFRGSRGHYDDDDDDDDYDRYYTADRHVVDKNINFQRDRDGYDDDHDTYYNPEINHTRNRRHRHGRASEEYRYEETDRQRNYNGRPPPPPPPRPPTDWQPSVSTSSDASRKASSTIKSTKTKSTNFLSSFWKRSKSNDRPIMDSKIIDGDKEEGVDDGINKGNQYKAATAATTDISSTTTTTTYNPIDYQFPSKSISIETSSKQGPIESEEDIPLTGNTYERDGEIVSSDPKYNKESLDKDEATMPRYASARQDAIARYRSTKMGKIRLGTSSFIVGSAVGGFMGQSIFNNGKMMALVFGFMFWIMSMLRNAYGEMSRALGLGLIYLLQRTKAVRKQYRTGPHIRSMCRLGPRRPFPPLMEGVEENPWKYAPRSRDDPDFEMTKALLCVVLIGSICGGNVPLIPTWMGSAGGAAAFAVFGMGKNARGDLMRTMGMRVVALTGEAMRINADLRIANKVLIVSGKIFDKIMILDRKHRIKDRLVRGATMAYDMASRTFTSVQNDIQQGSGDGYSRGMNEEERRRTTRPR